MNKLTRQSRSDQRRADKAARVSGEEKARQWVLWDCARKGITVPEGISNWHFDPHGPTPTANAYKLEEVVTYSRFGRRRRANYKTIETLLFTTPIPLYVVPCTDAEAWYAAWAAGAKPAEVYYAGLGR